MNLQERLEVILSERRGYVNGREPGPQAAMEGLLMVCAEGALRANDSHDRDGWLVRLAGLALYVLHPDDEPEVEGVWLTVDDLPLPPRSQALRAGDVVPVGDGIDYPDHVMVKRGDGTFKRKPRPDATR